MITKNQALVIVEKQYPTSVCKCTSETDEGYIITTRSAKEKENNIKPAVFVYKADGKMEMYYPPRHGGKKHV